MSSVGTSPITTQVPALSVGTSVSLNANLTAPGTSVSFLLGQGIHTLSDEIVTAAEARGTAKIVSKPHVLTLNNQARTIHGTQISVQTNQNNISVQFINFALKPTARPQSTKVGTIQLNVNIENREPDFSQVVDGIPSVATQSLQTSVLIGDGQTLVIGGIFVQDQNNISQVPALGSIPLIGSAFKSTSIVKSTAELMFFITPRIQTAGSLNTTPAGERPSGQQS